jgi:transcriptional regulator with XRE-family HTH domain
MYMAKVQTRFRKPPFNLTYIRKYRKKAGLTLEQLEDRLNVMHPELEGTTHASLGRIERGLQPYRQPLLEAIADALNTDTASLLMRDPDDPHGIWSIWDQAKPAERKMIVDIAKTIVKTGT